MDERIARFIEKWENKCWGKYRGIVVDRNDPEQLGRLKVQVPSLLGDAVTGWAFPVAPYAGNDLGIFFIPQVGDVVWVEFVEGEIDHPLWTGCGWAKPGGQSEIPVEAQQNYPECQVIKTASGNTIVLSDVQGDEKITILAKSGCEITIDPNGDTITIQAGSVLIQSTSALPEELATKTFVQQIFDTHTHPSGVGPTGPPLLVSSTNPRSLTTVLKAE
jgi:uncharacterized protein involved in type VI secretion and phage assembly